MYCDLCGTTQSNKVFPSWAFFPFGMFCSKCGEFDEKILKEKMKQRPPFGGTSFEYIDLDKQLKSK